MRTRWPVASSSATQRPTVASELAAKAPKAGWRCADGDAATDPRSSATSPRTPRGQRRLATASTMTRAGSAGRGGAFGRGAAAGAASRSGAQTSHRPHGGTRLSPK